MNRNLVVDKIKFKQKQKKKNCDCRKIILIIGKFTISYKKQFGEQNKKQKFNHKTNKI